MNVHLIAKGSVTKTYAGAAGCACGCNGTYAVSGASVTRRVNEINRAIEAGLPVTVHNLGNGSVCYELIKPNTRVIRVYL